MEGSTIYSCCLAHVCDQQRSKCTRETPRSQHETINRAHISRAKVISGKRRHGAESSPITHKDDKADQRQDGCGTDAGKKPEEYGLSHKHHPEGCAPRDRIAGPRPKHSSESVTDANNSYHAGSCHRAYSGKLLEQWGVLPDHRNPRT